MLKGKDIDNAIVIGARVRLIMDIAGLEIPGFAEFTGISESHLYAVINGNKKLTESIADRIGKKFGIKGPEILRPDFTIPVSIRKAKALLQFYLRDKESPEYFTGTKDDRKASYFIENVLLKTVLFDDPKYLWEIRECCLSMNRYYSSDRLSKFLKYQVEKGNLMCEKRWIKLRDGGYGERMVDVFYKPAS